MRHRGARPRVRYAAGMSDGETYDIIDDMPATPRLPGQVVLSEDADRAIDAVGIDIVSQAKAANRESVLLRIQRRGRPLTYVPIRLR